MLVGPAHGGGIRSSTTIYGPSYEPIHREFQQSGCIDSLRRLVAVLKREHSGETVRFVKTMPVWLTHPCFANACSQTSIRDADEYTRRFKRLRRLVQTGNDDESDIVRGDGASVQAKFNCIEYSVAAARVAFGAAMEVVASASAMQICDPAHIPVDENCASRLAWLCHDAYMAALFTDAHATYIVDTLSDTVGNLHRCDPHIDQGAPCIQRTTSISMLPNLAAKFEKYCASQNIDCNSKHLLSVLFRCGQSGSRGWDSALKASLGSDGSQWVLHMIFKACLIGMHPQMHPSARPDWTQRALVVALLDQRLSTENMNRLLWACGNCTKECIRIYMCSILHQLPATRSALARVQNSIGLLRSAPSELVPVSLAAAAQNIVAAGIDVGEVLSTVGSSGKDLLELLKSAIQNRIGKEPRIRSRALVAHMHKTPGRHGVVAKMYTVLYNSSWFGRAAGGDDETAVAMSSNSLHGLTLIQELAARAFRTQFIPIWLHGHGHGVRTSRFDESQHAHMLKTSSLQCVISSVDAETALKIQRRVLRSTVASSASISEIGHILGFAAKDQNLIDNANTFEEAIVGACNLSPAAGSHLMLFGRITSMKNRLLSFSLGDATRTRQLTALKNRFELECDDCDVAASLPRHSFVLYTCLECKRVTNAYVDDKTKMVAHNEIGLTATMLRVGGLGCHEEVRCARRSSAALRTALHKQDSASKNRIELIDSTDESIATSIQENGNVTHAAKLRRDIRSCAEQTNRAMACGDQPLVQISLIGRVIRTNGSFYSICCFCGSIVKATQLKRFDGEICCCRCDATMVNRNQKNTVSQAARFVTLVDTMSTRPPPALFVNIVPTDRLNCRFCNKSPPMSSSAARFKVMRAPNDTSGRNGALPPPLRVAAFCSSHWKPWLATGLQKLTMSIVLAHISEKAVPVFGAEENSRPALTYRRQPQKLGATHKLIMKKVRSANMSRKKP